MNLAKSLRDLFSGVSDAANQYQVVKPGRAARDLARRIRNEDASYDNFTRNLASLSRALPEEIENRDLLRGVRLKFGHDHADRLEEDLLQTEDALRNLKAVLEHASTSTNTRHATEAAASSHEVNSHDLLRRHLAELSKANQRVQFHLAHKQVSLPIPGEHRSSLHYDVLFRQHQEEPGIAITANCFTCNCQGINARPASETNTAPSDDEFSRLFESAYHPPAASSVQKLADGVTLSTQSEGPGGYFLSLAQGDTMQHGSSVQTKADVVVGRTVRLLFTQTERTYRFLSIADLNAHGLLINDHKGRIELAFNLSSALLLLWASDARMQLVRWQSWGVSFDAEEHGEQWRFYLHPLTRTSSSTAFQTLTREPAIAYLGLRLIELVYGCTLDQVRRAGMIIGLEAQEDDAEMLDLLTVKQLLEQRQIGKRFGQAFEDVVNVCVNQQYRERKGASIKTIDFRDRAFMSPAAAMILLPLYEEMRRYNHCTCDPSSQALPKANYGLPYRTSQGTMQIRKNTPPTSSGVGSAAKGNRPPSSGSSRKHDFNQAGPEEADSDDVNLVLSTELARPSTERQKSLSIRGISTHGQGQLEVGDSIETQDGTRSQPTRTQDASLDVALDETRHSGREGRQQHSSESSSSAGSCPISQGGPIEETDEEADIPGDLDDSRSSTSELTTTMNMKSDLAILPEQRMADLSLSGNHQLMPFRGIASQVVLRCFYKATCRGNGPNDEARGLRPFAEGSARGDGSTQLKRKKPADEEDTATPSTVDSSGNKKRASNVGKTFACPFFKKNPLAYTRCCQYTLRRIRDVKQHLNRCHQRGIYCPLCFETFSQEILRDEHVQDSVENRASCTQNLRSRPEGIHREQRQLLARKAPSGQSREQQWYGIFEILFPGFSPRPESPYIESGLMSNILVYQRFMSERGPQILSQVLTANGAVTWHVPPNEADIATFQTRLMEDGFREIFDRWISSGGQTLATGSSDEISSSPPNSSDVNPSDDSQGFNIEDQQVTATSFNPPSAALPNETTGCLSHRQNAWAQTRNAVSYIDHTYGMVHLINAEEAQHNHFATEGLQGDPITSEETRHILQTFDTMEPDLTGTMPFSYID